MRPHFNGDFDLTGRSDCLDFHQTSGEPSLSLQTVWAPHHMMTGAWSQSNGTYLLARQFPKWGLAEILSNQKEMSKCTDCSVSLKVSTGELFAATLC